MRPPESSTALKWLTVKFPSGWAAAAAGARSTARIARGEAIHFTPRTSARRAPKSARSAGSCRARGETRSSRPPAGRGSARSCRAGRTWARRASRAEARASSSAAPRRSSRSARAPKPGRRQPRCSAARRARAAPPRCFGLRERFERIRVAGKRAEGGAVLDGCGADAAGREVELAELGARPGGRLRLAGRRVEREQHRLLGAAGAAEQLARVRDARIDREARLERRHAVEGAEGLGVAAELDERVPDDAVVTCSERCEPLRTAAEGERPCKIVAGQSERAEGAQRLAAAGLELE